MFCSPDKRLIVTRQHLSTIAERYRSDPKFTSGAHGILLPLTLFVLNVWICSRVLRSEYFNQFPSIEGGMLSVERYIRMHWSWWDWYPVWWGGMPFPRVYQPLLHFTVAIVSALTGASIPTAFHFVTVVAYALGAVTFYWLAKTLFESRRTAFCGALVFSLFSPSLLFLPVIRTDASGWWNARRLQALIQYGEGPGIAGLTLAMLALGLVHLALQRKTALSTCLAALSIAAVPATNWPMTMALLMGLTSYVMALDWADLRKSLSRLLLIGALAFGLAAIPVPPSQILGTFAQANRMDPRPIDNPIQRMAVVILILAMALARLLLDKYKVPLRIRFPVLFALLTGYLVVMDVWTHIRLMPFAYRFHVALEIPLILIFTALCKMAIDRWPSLRAGAIALLLILCIVQTVNYRRYVRVLAQKIDVPKTVECQVARWCDRNLCGERILTFGSVSFWLNEFTDTPQMTGLFEHSLTNPQNMSFGYMVASAGSSPEQSADGALLWMKAWAVRAVAIGGPNSGEAYRATVFPYRFRDKLPLAWSNGDDYIYLVPQRTPGLARVVRERDLVKKPPAHGLDLAELRPFVAALDDPTLPVASFQWLGSNDARIRGALTPDQVYSVSINWDRGWTATADGLPIPVRADGLGLIAIAPHCSGPCEVQLHWSAAPESRIVTAITLATLLGCGLWIWRERRLLKTAIETRPDSFPYRAKCFVRRNKTLVRSAGVGLLVPAIILSGLYVAMQLSSYSFSGRWSDQNKYPISIDESGQKITIRYLPVHSPTKGDFPGQIHTGRRLSRNEISVDFGFLYHGQRCCTGSLRYPLLEFLKIAPDRIDWSNDTFWPRDGDTFTGPSVHSSGTVNELMIPSPATH